MRTDTKKEKYTHTNARNGNNPVLVVSFLNLSCSPSFYCSDADGVVRDWTTYTHMYPRDTVISIGIVITITIETRFQCVCVRLLHKLVCMLRGCHIGVIHLFVYTPIVAAAHVKIALLKELQSISPFAMRYINVDDDDDVWRCSAEVRRLRVFCLAVCHTPATDIPMCVACVRVLAFAPFTQFHSI